MSVLGVVLSVRRADVSSVVDLLARMRLLDVEERVFLLLRLDRVAKKVMDGRRVRSSVKLVSTLSFE